MRIFWVSDSPTVPSGFGNVSRFVCAGLARLGHQVSILGWQAHGSPTTWQGCTIYPVRHDGFGADVLLTYLQKLRPDVLITLADVWWLTFIADPQIANFTHTAAIPWALYYPIDGDMGDGQLPPSWVKILQTVDLPISMSQYGREVTRSNGVESAYIPHGVDTHVFCPPFDREAAKRLLGYTGKFVILSDARNQPRKMLPRTLEIFRRFALGKDDVLLHLHCDPQDPAARTPEYHYDLRADIAHLGLDGCVCLSEGMSIGAGLPLERLAAIYQAADVHLLSSWGEGFGLPTLQSAAAGVVPLACDYTASRELVIGHGEPLPVRTFIPDQFGLRRALIDIDQAVERLEALYHHPAVLQAKSQAAVQFAAAYDWENIVPQWHELLQHEVPRLHNRMMTSAAGSRVMLHSQVGNWGMPAGRENELVRAVRTAVPGLMDGVNVTLKVVENKAGQLTAEVYRDARVSEHNLTLPVTLPPAASAKTKTRIAGCVYLTGEGDVPLVQALSAIFPGLNAWSTVPINLGLGRVSGRPVHTKVVPLDDPAYTRHLASTTLALDLEGRDPDLPRRAASLCVPCLSRDFLPEQRFLWPRLSLPGSGLAMALDLARTLLTDQGEAAEVCAQAQERLGVNTLS